MANSDRISEISEQTLRENYAKYLMVGGGHGGITLVRGKGVRVEDITGKSYIDCTSQSWAFDFALFDKKGNLIGNPHHYRDRRTKAIIEYCRRTGQRVPEDKGSP